MTYNLKWLEETAWAVIVAGLTYIVGVAAAGMPTDNWKIWAVTVAAGVGRVAFATVISRLGQKGGTPEPAIVPAAGYTTTPNLTTFTASTAEGFFGQPYNAQPTTATTPAPTLPDHTGTLPRPEAASPPEPTPIKGPTV